MFCSKHTLYFRILKRHCHWYKSPFALLNFEYSNVVDSLLNPRELCIVEYMLTRRWLSCKSSRSIHLKYWNVAGIHVNPSVSAGNLACDAVGGGRIIFYDFGMMDQLSMPLKRGLVNLIFGIYGNDVKEVVDSLEDMDVIRKVSVWSV